MKTNVVEMLERTGGISGESITLLQLVLASIALQPSLSISSIKTVLHTLLELPALSAKERVEGMKLVQILESLEQPKRKIFEAGDSSPD